MKENRATGTMLTPAQIKSILERLEEPFDPELLFWKPQATNQDKTKAVAAVYADPRAYSDRLSEVLGHDGWSEHYQALATPYIKPGWKDKPAVEGHKLVVICTVTIDGVGSHSSMGESDASDENAATSAEAQAFKRACTKFGLGRYLYDFPKNQWCDYDSKKRTITRPPAIPDWAKPKVKCADCDAVVSDFTYAAEKKDNEGVVIGTEEKTMAMAEVLRHSQQKYKAKLCGHCMRKRAEGIKASAGGRL